MQSIITGKFCQLNLPPGLVKSFNHFYSPGNNKWHFPLRERYPSMIWRKTNGFLVCSKWVVKININTSRIKPILTAKPSCFWHNASPSSLVFRAIFVFLKRFRLKKNLPGQLRLSKHCETTSTCRNLSSYQYMYLPPNFFFQVWKQKYKIWKRTRKILFTAMLLSGNVFIFRVYFKKFEIYANELLLSCCVSFSVQKRFKISLFK